MADIEPLPTGLRTIISEDGLTVRIYYLECLAQATYLIAHDGSAFIVDPRRDVDAFLHELQSENLTLKGVLETHFHADFVSGHFELGQRTNTTVYFGPGAAERTKFPVHELKDNEIIDFTSRYAFKVLHTPGHTLESVVYLLIDKQNNDKPLKAFTGDTLFVGSVGRPDLVGSLGCTAEDMGKMMFNTLQTKILTLPDDVQVFPAHGAGSPCGKNLSSDLFSTIGKQRLTNTALTFTDESEFVKYITADQPTAPQYFPYNVHMNVSGATHLAEDLKAIPRLSAEEFKKLVDEESFIIIDTRNASDFASGHIPGALNFPLGAAGGVVVGPEDGNFAIWVGTLVPSESTYLIVSESGKDGETLQRLARIGYTKVRGILTGGMQSYREAGYPVDTIERIDLAKGPTLNSYLSKGDHMLDVRTEGEYKSNTAKGATNLPLAHLNSLLSSLDQRHSYIAYCVSGYRAAIASSILKRAGFKVQDIRGGFAAISVYASDLTTSEKVCPTMQKLIEDMNKAS